MRRGPAGRSGLRAASRTKRAAGTSLMGVSVHANSLEVHMQGRDLDDAGIMNWCERMHLVVIPQLIEEKVLVRSKDGTLLAREMNFAENRIGDYGLRSLLQLLWNFRIGVLVLKLFNNRLGRASASSLADWIICSPVALWELHLSHNYLDQDSALCLLEAVACSDVYPPARRPGSGSAAEVTDADPTAGHRAPLWLRLDQNFIEDSELFPEKARAELADLRSEVVPTSGRRLRGYEVCWTNHDKGHCRPGSCARGCCWDRCPLVHAAFFTRQKEIQPFNPMPIESYRWNFTADPDEETRRWRVAVPLAKESVCRYTEPSVFAVGEKDMEPTADSGPSTPRRHRRDIHAGLGEAITPEAPRSRRQLCETPITQPHQHPDGTEKMDSKECDTEFRQSSLVKSTGVRVQLSSERVSGTVGRIMRSFAWVTPDVKIDADLDIHRGDVFLSFRDLPSSASKLTRGARVSFTFYCDCDGLGAENCQVELHSMPVC